MTALVDVAGGQDFCADRARIDCGIRRLTERDYGRRFGMPRVVGIAASSVTVSPHVCRRGFADPAASGLHAGLLVGLAWAAGQERAR